MATTDTEVNLIINEISQEQLDELDAAGTVPPNQMFFTDRDADNSVVLYNTTGQNDDGAMTQKAVTDELAKKAGLNVENNFTVMPKVNGTPINQIDDTVYKYSKTITEETYIGQNGSNSSTYTITKYGKVCVLDINFRVKQRYGTSWGNFLNIQLPDGCTPAQGNIWEYVVAYSSVDRYFRLGVNEWGYLVMATADWPLETYHHFLVTIAYITK